MTNGRHGGDIFAAARELGRPVAELLDCSASINPLGVPSEVRAALTGALEELVHYPEIAARPLHEALAAYHDLAPAQVLPAAGSTELIYLLPRVLRPRRALLVRPCFGEYRRALEQAGTAIDCYDLAPEQGFRLDPAQLLAELHAETGLVLLANPGSPHGTGYAPALLRELAASLPAGVLLAVDEAFIDFCPTLALDGALTQHPNLLLLRSLTKFYAIPGLRLGYALGPAPLLERLAAAQLPWGLSGPAQAAGLACLAAQNYREHSAQVLPGWRAELSRGLTDLGLQVFPSQANFLLGRLGPAWPAAGALAERLRRQGVLVRNCANFPPLDERFLRLAVRTPPEHARLLAALAEQAPPSCS